MSGEIRIRENIPDKYKWKLDKIFPSQEELEDVFGRAGQLVDKMEEFRGKLADGNVLFDCLRRMDELGRLLDRLSSYSHMKLDEDRRQDKYQALNDRVRSLLVRAGTATSFIEPELVKMDPNHLREITSDDRFNTYRMLLKEVERGRAHVLSDAEEHVVAAYGEIMDAPSEIFSMLTNADMEFGSIEDASGKKVEFSEGRAAVFLRSPSRPVRKRAYDLLYSTYGHYKNTLSQTLANSVKVGSVTAKLRHFESSIEMGLFSDNINVQVYDSLIEAVTRNIEKLHDYVALKKEVLGLDEIRMYDLYVPLVENFEKEVPYEQAREMVKAGLARLGDEYVSEVDKGLSSGWVDVFENKGKRSGAYSSGSYDTMPYILLNYNEKLSDVFTLAHEMGHSMHSLYSNRNQEYRNAGYSIFVAEVASIFNETLLMDYMLHRSEGKEKLYLLDYDLEGYRGTLFRQTMFAEFEKIVHGKADAGEALTPEVLCREYYELNRKYYGPEMHLDDEIALEWSRIPHFYSPFYVYKYAIGFSAAKALSKPIIDGDRKRLEQYLSFLKSGGSDYPLELLKRAGTDMSTPEPVENVLALFADAMNEFKDTRAALKT